MSTAPADPFNRGRPPDLPRVDARAVPAEHADLLRHYVVLGEIFLWKEFVRVYEGKGRGAVWRHPRAKGKEVHELRHEEMLADLGHRVVSLPENFPRQPEGVRPPDLEVDGRIVQLRYKRRGAVREHTDAVRRGIQDARKSAPCVVYVLEEGTAIDKKRVRQKARFVFDLDDRLRRATVYRQRGDRLEFVLEEEKLS